MSRFHTGGQSVLERLPLSGGGLNLAGFLRLNNSRGCSDYFELNDLNGERFA